MQENSKEKPKSASFLEWEQQVFYTPERAALTNLTSIPHLEHQFFYLAQYTDTNLTSIFHPPRYS